MRLPFRKRKGGTHFVYNLSKTSEGATGATGARESLGRLDQKTSKPPFDPKRHKDTKRAHIAFVFVYGYMIFMVLILLGVPAYNALIGDAVKLELEKVLSQAGALLGTPLGFVVGYYFKEDKD